MFIHNDRPFFLRSFIDLFPQHLVCQSKLVYVPDAVDEIIIVFSSFLLRTLIVTLLRRGPFIPYEVQEVLLDVMASIIDYKSRLAPLVTNLECLMNSVITRLRVALLR